MEESKAGWVLLNKHHIYMLLLAIRHYKKWREEQPIADQFMEYLRQAESKLRDELHLIRGEELREEEAAEEQAEAERIWEGSHAPGSRAPWLGSEERE